VAQIDVTINDMKRVDQVLHVSVTIPGSGKDVNGLRLTDEHLIVVPLAALDTRRTIYGLANNVDALDAVLREHVKRICGLPDSDDHTDPNINKLGGLRHDVTVQVSPSVRTNESLERR